MDNISKEHRRWVMQQVKSTDTKPELLVRSFLHRSGFRFRLHLKNLPGKPDIVLRKYMTVIEIRGCFWHHHENCKIARIPKSNIPFWMEKFRHNMERDERNEKSLKELGWRLIVLWECEIKEKLHLLPSMIKNSLDLAHYEPIKESEQMAAENGISYEAKSYFNDKMNKKSRIRGKRTC